MSQFSLSRRSKLERSKRTFCDRERKAGKKCARNLLSIKTGGRFTHPARLPCFASALHACARRRGDGLRQWPVVLRLPLLSPASGRGRTGQPLTACGYWVGVANGDNLRIRVRRAPKAVIANRLNGVYVVTPCLPAASYAGFGADAGGKIERSNPAKIAGASVGPPRPEKEVRRLQTSAIKGVKRTTPTPENFAGGDSALRASLRSERRGFHFRRWLPPDFARHQAQFKNQSW